MVKYSLMGVLALLSVTSLNAAAAPGSVDPAALKLWLDASDPDGDDNPANNPADGGALTTWVDKSGNGNDATTITAGINATYDSSVAESINGKPAFLFWNTPYDTALDLRPITTPDTTIFTVYVQKITVDNNHLGA